MIFKKRKKALKLLCITQLFILGCVSKTYSQTKISAKEALTHVGERVTICDEVYSSKLMDQSKTTLLYLGGSYPDELLIIKIAGHFRNKFNISPEEIFLGKQISVTGKVVNCHGKPEILVSDPLQIQLTFMDDLGKSNFN